MADAANSIPVWQPTRVLRVKQTLATSAAATIVETDAGDAVLKALGNASGEHALAKEWIGTRLARAIGLVTFPIAIVDLDEASTFPLPDGRYALPGPAFAARWTPGETWNDTDAVLDELDNPQDLAKLVVFDTWILNPDRYPPDLATRKPNFNNVYLADADFPNRRVLVAMDHTHCFGGGEHLSPRKLVGIDFVKDDRLYGNFPKFARFLTRENVLTAAAIMRAVDGAVVHAAFDGLPKQWQVGREIEEAMTDLLCRRAAYLADNIANRLGYE